MKLALVTALALPLLAGCSMLPKPPLPDVPSVASLPKVDLPSTPKLSDAKSAPTANANAPAPATTDASDTKAKAASSNPPASDAAASASGDTAPPTGLPDLGATIGTRDGGAAPKIFASLKHGMSPAEVAKLFPGAERVGANGTSRVAAKWAPGIDYYVFAFQDGGLYSATMYFDRRLKTREFWSYLVKVSTAKYGKAGDDDVERQLIVWPSAQLYNQGDEHFALKALL